ncbi:MAG: GNAT family N-acetyltransferase [Chloroflexota bacterium]|nr:GNAT family N-acetyltransferase [Chloroflexota bacterium]
MRATTQPVEIREAETDDLRACLSLDDSYTSTHTWQIEAVRGEPGTVLYNLNSSVMLGDTPLSITFRPIKLPRARKVLGPVAAVLKDGSESAQMSKLQAWSAADMVLVAQQGSKLCGYIVITLVPSSGIGWISSLVVAISMRRQGVGSMLMAAARRWARYGGGISTRAFMLETPTKNYPAVAFCRKEGFTFCGYTDYSFNNGDIVLLFASPVVV